MALKNLLVRIGADLSGLNKGMQSAQQKINKFSTSANNSLNRLGKTAAVVGTTVAAGLALAPAIKDAMQFEALMGTIGETLGSSADDFAKWQSSVGQSFGMSKLESAKMMNNFSIRLKGIAKDEQDLFNKSTTLMKASAVIRSKTGMSQMEISDRMRSALNQEADGADELGVDVRTSAMLQSKAYKQLANNAPWDELSTQMKRNILYHHILESVSTNFGNKIADTTSMRMGVFQASLENVNMALGRAFLPILNVVLPILTKFAIKVESAMGKVRQFIRALVGKKGDIPTGTAQVEEQANAYSGLGDAQAAQAKDAKKAAKAAKDAGGVAGFDQVNTLSSGSGSEGGADDGGAGAGGTGGMSDGLSDTGDEGEGAFEKISKGIREFAKKVKKFFGPAIDFIRDNIKGAAKFIGQKVKQLSDFWKEHGDQVVQAFSNIWKFIKPILKFVWGYITDAVKGLVDGVIKTFLGITKFLTGIFTGDWKLAFEGIKDIVFGVVQTVWNFFSLTIFGGIRKGLLSLVKNFTDDFAKIVVNMKGAFNNIGPWFLNIGKTIMSNITKPITAIKEWYKTNVTDKILKQFNDIDFLAGLVESAMKMFDKLISPFKTVYTWFKENVAQVIINTLVNNKDAIAKKAGEIWEAMKKKFWDVYDWFKKNVADKIAKALNAINPNFTDAIKTAFTSTYNKAANAINYMIKLLNKAADGINKAVPGNPVGKIDYKLPLLATGGVVNKATNAIIGEDGAEAVMPLEKNTGWISNLAGQLASKGGSGGSGDIILNIDGRQLARIVKPYLENENKRVGTTMKIRTT
jgi:phage-related protein